MLPKTMFSLTGSYQRIRSLLICLLFTPGLGNIIAPMYDRKVPVFFLRHLHHISAVHVVDSSKTGLYLGFMFCWARSIKRSTVGCLEGGNFPGIFATVSDTRLSKVTDSDLQICGCKSCGVFLARLSITLHIMHVCQGLLGNTEL